MVVIVVGLAIIQYRSDSKIKKLTFVVDKQKKSYDSLLFVTDSLKSETSRLTIDLGRYEVAYSMFVDESGECAKKYDKILSKIE